MRSRRARAFGVILSLVLAIGVCLVASSRSPIAVGDDSALFRAVIERMRAGEGYYEATRTELVARRYPTTSIFNWRPPTLYGLLAAAPPRVMRTLLEAMALGVVFLAYTSLRVHVGNGLAMASAILLVPALAMVMIERFALLTETWAGTLIALSAVAYMGGHRRVGLTAGLAATLIRELAILYLAVTAALAWRERRHRELVLHGAAAAALAAGFAVHASLARVQMPSDGIVGPTWIHFGGPAFLVAICRMNVGLFLAPSWMSAVFLPFAVFGLALAPEPIRSRIGLPAIAYLITFAVIGRGQNPYWGAIPAPLLVFGLAAAPGALRRIARCIF